MDELSHAVTGVNNQLSSEENLNFDGAAQSRSALDLCQNSRDSPVSGSSQASMAAGLIKPTLLPVHTMAMTQQQQQQQPGRR